MAIKRTMTSTVTKDFVLMPGSVVNIKGSIPKEPEVVVEAETRSSQAYDGTYYADVIVTIAKRYIGVPNTLTFTYVLSGASMRVPGAKEIELSDIEVTGEIPLKKKTVITYFG